MNYADTLIGTPPPEVNPPISAADRRPNDRPFYIDECCPGCGGILVYEDIIHGDTRWDDIFFDEFACPKCNDGSHLDWTPQNIQRMNYPRTTHTLRPGFLTLHRRKLAKASALLWGFS